MSDYNDTPPTVAGYFWVKSRRSGQEWIAERTRHGVWERISGEVAVAAGDGEAAELVQFGHRIPTNAELGELPGLIEKYGSCKASEEGWRDGDNIFLYKKACDESDAALAKINAILGVAE